MARVEIINGDHIPPIPFMVVNNHGLHVDLSDVVGELWDPTVAKVEWGLVHTGTGKIFGRVTLKNGQGRVFWDASLIQPYLNAYVTRWLEEKAKHEANVKKRQQDKEKALAKRSTDEDMTRAIRAQLERELGI